MQVCTGFRTPEAGCAYSYHCVSEIVTADRRSTFVRENLHYVRIVPNLLLGPEVGRHANYRLVLRIIVVEAARQIPFLSLSAGR